MGFLHKLWDETLAGPAPETGLGKLRKYNSSFLTAAATTKSAVVTVEDVPISRSITIIRTHSNNFRSTKTSDPASSSSVPCSPRSPSTPETPGGDFKKLTRRKSADSSAFRSPTIHDWFSIFGDFECCGS
ncbi:hypothetical protein RIF29_16654 [Crotalaria pallida]|uniref:Uncharacterized protein n=1 Tax=Crotalaria pallida TaxID=3830 RepID=A0AAN9FLH7_CROPI